MKKKKRKKLKVKLKAKKEKLKKEKRKHHQNHLQKFLKLELSKLQEMLPRLLLKKK